MQILYKEQADYNWILSAIIYLFYLYKIISLFKKPKTQIIVNHHIYVRTVKANLRKWRFLFAGFFCTSITRNFLPWHVFFVLANHTLGVFLGTKWFLTQCRELWQDELRNKTIAYGAAFDLLHDLSHSGITIHSRCFINKTNLFSKAICHYLCYLKKTLLSSK